MDATHYVSHHSVEIKKKPKTKVYQPPVNQQNSPSYLMVFSLVMFPETLSSWSGAASLKPSPPAPPAGHCNNKWTFTSEWERPDCQRHSCVFVRCVDAERATSTNDRNSHKWFCQQIVAALMWRSLSDWSTRSCSFLKCNSCFWARLSSGSSLVTRSFSLGNQAQTQLLGYSINEWMNECMNIWTNG